jgi:long-chain acyl-CoA synthetase
MTDSQENTDFRMANAQNGSVGVRATGKVPKNNPVFWRVEGSLVDLSAVRPVAYFTWNAHTFAERWARRGALLLETLVRPVLYATHRAYATRILHVLLRGVSRDRLDLLGEEYFHYVLKPRLKLAGIEALQRWMREHGQVVLVSQGLDHVMRPLAQHLGIERLVANRLEFRGGVATGRLLEPVVRPRGPLALLLSNDPDGRIDKERLLRDLSLEKHSERLDRAIFSSSRATPQNHAPLVVFGAIEPQAPLSVRRALRGKRILLIGVTGFIAKVWLEHLLLRLPEVGKIYLLIRRQRTTSAQRRFEKLVEESPVFDRLEARYGAALSEFLAEKVEVVEGDVSQPGLGLDPEVRKELAASVDLVVNSAGLTDFNPDLRDALSSNIDSAVHLAEFLRESRHAALMHLSTCYVVGQRDGRVDEQWRANYTPAGVENFDAEREWRFLQELVRATESRAQSAEIEAALRRQILGRRGSRELEPGQELESLMRKNRQRWLRHRLTHAGMRRAKRLGWPNTYTFTKSLGESLLASRGAGLPIAIVRPSIVETSTHEPFRGWNEGINTSAPLSYLLGTFFRQLPSNERKCLDLIPVDMVCRGMSLIAAALMGRRHKLLYQLCTSAGNPCDMGRSIELTALAHRKHYRAQQGLEHWLRTRFDTIPVSKERYRKFSVPAQKVVIGAINRTASALQFRRAPLARAERDLARVEKLIELYEPFILQNEQVFESAHVEMLSAALLREEQPDFSYEPGSIDWWDYWINIHVPALRRWVYPLIEGQKVEARPKRVFRLPVTPPQTAIPRTQASWPSS